MADCGMTVAGVEKEEALRRLGPEWDALADRLSGVTPFLRYKWMATWWKQWGSRHQLRVITVRDGAGRLVAIAPFYISRDPWFKMRARRVGFLADTYTGSDYLGLLVQSGYEQQAARAVTRALIETRREWDYLELDHTLEANPAMRELRAALSESGYRERLVSRSTCPYAALPESFDDYLGSVGHNLRYNFRRRFKALHREGSVGLVVLCNGPDIQARFPELVGLHKLRFASQAKTSSFLLPEVQRFHRDLIGVMGPADGLRLFILEIKGRAVAALYGFSSGTKFLYFQAGMDPQWARLSVGLVLMGCVIEQVIKEGHTEFDFLRGDEAYKYQWATGVRTTHTVRVFDRRAKAQWVRAWAVWHQKARAVKRALVGLGLAHPSIPGEDRRARAGGQPPPRRNRRNRRATQSTHGSSDKGGRGLHGGLELVEEHGML
jgi:CelD/BcsL family acetyltransferase involved in cellulose biosynthesis